MRKELLLFAAGALLCGGLAGPALAQDSFNSAASGGGGRGNESYNGVGNGNGGGGGNTTRRTGTQGVVGNVFCEPPHTIINGQDVTPLNWSCPGGGSQGNPGSWNPDHPGFPSAAGSNPCQPGGPGGYNYLDNAEGTRLPPGCVRPAGKTTAKSDPRYQARPPGSYIVPPVGPPGSYVQPERRPGDFIQPEGRPGDYVSATRKSGPGGSGTQMRRGPGGAIILSPGNTEDADENPGRTQSQSPQPGGNGDPARFQPRNTTPYRQDTQAMQGGVFSNNSVPRYRQDTGAMQGALGNLVGSGVSRVITKPAAKNTGAKKPTAAEQAAANARAAQTVNGLVKLFGNGP